MPVITRSRSRSRSRRCPRSRRLAMWLTLAVSTAWLVPASLMAGMQPSAAEPGAGSPNNPWPDDCNMRVGVVVDRSDSIRGASQENPALVRGAVGDLADRLSGTGASMAVWSFGTLASGYTGPAPYPGAPVGSTIVAGDYPSVGFTSLSTPAGIAAVKSTANAIPFTRSFGSDTDPDTRRVGATNWEAGLGGSSHGLPGAVAPNGDRPRDADVLVFFSDGAPTVDNAQLAAGVAGLDATDAKVDAALAAAHVVKTTGAPTRIIGVGVGNVNAPNLERITAGYPAAREFEDYWITDFGGLGDTLVDVATRICGGRLTIRKLVPGSGAGSWVPRPGWRFTTSFPGGQPAYLDPGTDLTTGADGAASTRWLNPAGDTDVTVREALPDGQRLHGVTCVTEDEGNQGVGRPPGATEQQFAAPTFTVRVPRHGHTLCDVRNYLQGPPPTLDKSAAPASLPNAGDVTFTLALANPDLVESVRIDALLDDRFGNLLDPGNDRVRDNTCDDAPAGSRVMLPGASGSCTFVARVEPAEDGGPHVDVVTLHGVELLPTGGEGDAVTLSDDASVAFTDLPGPDLAVSKDDGRDTVAPGDETTYAVTVANHSDIAATGVVLADELPDGVSFVSASDGGALDEGEGDAPAAVVWPWFGLDPGEERIFEVTVRVDDDAREGDEVRNRVVVRDDRSHGDDPDPQDNAAEDLDTVDQGVDDTPPADPRPDPSGIVGSLPRTGGEIISWVLWGSALVAAGVALVGLGRRGPRWRLRRS